MNCTAHFMETACLALQSWDADSFQRLHEQAVGLLKESVRLCPPPARVLPTNLLVRADGRCQMQMLSAEYAEMAIAQAHAFCPDYRATFLDSNMREMEPPHRMFQALVVVTEAIAAPGRPYDYKLTTTQYGRIERGGEQRVVFREDWTPPEREKFSPLGAAIQPWFLEAGPPSVTR